MDVAKRENSAILLEDDYVKKYNGFDPNSDESYIIMSMFTDTYLNQSLSFASKAQKQYNSKAGRVDKGVKRESLWVLWRTYMPSVLTEIGYLTNVQEEQFLGSVKGQDYIASGLFRAFRDYKDEVEGISKKYDDDFENQKPYKMNKEDSLEVKAFKNSTKPEPIDTTVTQKQVDVKIVKEDDKIKNSVAKKDTIVLVKKDDKVNSVEDHKIAEKNNTRNSEIVYKVQLLSSDKKIPFDSDKLKVVEKLGEYMDNGVYKYTSGEFVNKKEAVELQSQLRKNGFKDAFVIAMQGGKRIPLK